MQRLAWIAVALAMTTAASALPLFPAITSRDINFGAFNSNPGDYEYSSNGTAPDLLNWTGNVEDHEATAYWPNWPAGPVRPIFDEINQNFGGDFELHVVLNGQDPLAGTGYVSLTGHGASTDPATPDLIIRGSVPTASGVVSGVLWELKLDIVALYGAAGRNSYSLEGVGTILGGLLADGVVGQQGGMRGSVDFQNAPAGWIPDGYTPATDSAVRLRAAYSGETGVIPEPASALLALLSVAVMRRR